MIDAIKTVIKPAAGPETPSRELLTKPTTIPPIIPAMSPDKGIGPIPSIEVDAKPMPRHKGSATKKTIKLAGRSRFQALIG